jgi:hypothetical protein
MADAQEVTGTPDKNQLYGRYQKDEDWRTKLNKKLRHKALDIPMDDDVQVKNTTTTNSGLGWKELAALGAILIGGGGLYQLGSYKAQQATPPAVVAPVNGESNYEIRFYDKDGKLIDVPRVPQK